MTPEEIKNHRRLNFRQTNAYAMQYGALMGVYVVVAEACFVLGLKVNVLMSVQSLLTLAYPFVLLMLAFRFRKQVSEGLPYSFGRGFFFTLLVVLYSGVWAALVALLYLQIFDHGYLFQTYLELITRPDMVKAMQESGLTAQVQASTGGLTPAQVVEHLQQTPASVFAAIILYAFILSAPIFSLISGLLTMRGNRRTY